MILPFAKLGALAVRTLSKPLANRVKAQAARHERFRNLIECFAQIACSAPRELSMPPLDLSKTHHKFSVNIQRRLYGHATNVEIRPLDPEKAVQAASDLLGEIVIFSVAATAVLLEVQRSARSEARKEAAQRREFEEIMAKVQALEENFEKYVKGQASTSTWIPFKHSQKPEKV